MSRETERLLEIKDVKPAFGTNEDTRQKLSKIEQRKNSCLKSHNSEKESDSSKSYDDQDRDILVTEYVKSLINSETTDEKT